MKNLFILLFFGSLNSFGQKFDLDSLQKATKSDTTTFIYMTALWCSPCLDKMPYYDAYFRKTKQPYKIVYLFDVEQFSYSKLFKIFPHIDFSDKLVIMPREYYSTAAIQINSHNKMFRNFIDKHKKYKPDIINLEKFTLASFMTIDSKGQSTVFDAPKLKGLSLKQIDDLIIEFINKK